MRGFSAQIPAALIDRIQRENPEILYIEPNVRINIAPPRSIKVTAKPLPPVQATPWGIFRVGGGVDGSGRHAWIIDTGIDVKHEDLNVGAGANFVLKGRNTANDGNGHGTHVAGTVAALDNGIGVIGVAAGAIVHPVRVLDNNGSGTIASVIAGVDYVMQNADPLRGDVANLSLGASGHFQSLHDAIVNAANSGIRFAIAAGNSAAHADQFEPAHIEHNNVVTVSASDSGDVFASFSNYGNPPVDVAAPGVGILSTWLRDGYATLNGTSMATPHVTGLMLLNSLNTDGLVIADPDGVADPIAHY
ncbi:MAG: S8 family serine peptidase [Proteobacteria bacterium]|nr:S8 family serine peptidase [Pseudomonadota bacterium]